MRIYACIQLYIYIYIYICMNIHINICVYLCTYEYICVYTEVYSHGVRSHCNTLQHTATLVTPCKTRQHTAVSSHGTRSSYFGRERSGWNFSKVSSTVIFYSWLSSELSFCEIPTVRQQNAAWKKRQQKFSRYSSLLNSCNICCIHWIWLLENSNSATTAQCVVARA